MVKGLDNKCVLPSSRLITSSGCSLNVIVTGFFCGLPKLEQSAFKIKFDWTLAKHINSTLVKVFGLQRGLDYLHKRVMLHGPTAVTVAVRPSRTTLCKGKRKPNLGGRAADRLITRDKTRNLSLKEITDTKGPVPIRFEVRDKQALMPHGEHAAHWSSYIGEVIRGVPLYHPTWLKVPKERKAMLIADIRAKSTVISRQGSRSLARLRDEMSSATREYPSLIDTFFVARTINGEFLLDEDRRIYEEMRRLEATSTYTADEINRLAKGGKQRGHIPSVGRFESGGASGSGVCGDDEESADEDEDGDGDS
nr:hypothetical protein [Tanacetum cinerariifolium]